MCAIGDISRHPRARDEAPALRELTTAGVRALMEPGVTVNAKLHKVEKIGVVLEECLAQTRYWKLEPGVAVDANPQKGAASEVVIEDDLAQHVLRFLKSHR